MTLILFTVTRPIARALHEGGVDDLTMFSGGRAADLTAFFNEQGVVPAFRNPRLTANNARHKQFCDMEARVPTEATQQFVKALAERAEVEAVIFQANANSETAFLYHHYKQHPHKKVQCV